MLRAPSVLRPVYLVSWLWTPSNTLTGVLVIPRHIRLSRTSDKKRARAGPATLRKTLQHTAQKVPKLSCVSQSVSRRHRNPSCARLETHHHLSPRGKVGVERGSVSLGQSQVDQEVPQLVGGASIGGCDGRRGVDALQAFNVASFAFITAAFRMIFSKIARSFSERLLLLCVKKRTRA